MTTGIYLIHFAPAYKHAKHYLGYADDIEPRIHAHLHRRGAKLTKVVLDAGCMLLLVRVWEDADRATERKFKRRSHVPMLCPICCGLAVQLPLFPYLPAYVPPDELQQPESNCGNEQPQHTESLFDFDAEADEYVNDLIGETQ